MTASRLVISSQLCESKPTRRDDNGRETCWMEMGGRSIGLSGPYGAEGMVRRQQRNDAITISKFGHIGRATSGGRGSRPYWLMRQASRNISINRLKKPSGVYSSAENYTLFRIRTVCIWGIDLKTPHWGRFPGYLCTGDVFSTSELISP